MASQHASVRHGLLLAISTAAAGVSGTITAGPVQPRQATPSVTAISGCHMHQTVQYCMVGVTEYRILATGTATTGLPASYTDCHAHATQTWCMNPNGGEVQIVLAEDAGGGSQTTNAPTPTAASKTFTAVTDCHLDQTEVLCSADATEYRVDTTATATSDIPPAYTGCHTHGSETFCLTPSGDDVQVQLASEAHDDSGANKPAGENCHFHAGVEHCVGAGGEDGPRSCGRIDREYNVPLRVGLLFVILVTSAIGVFGPIVLSKYLSAKANTALLIIKQFGTGVIMSTSLVHLFTHAELMFGNECLGELQYEATTAAIMMAGIFISFLVEYLGYRLVKWQANKKIQDSETSSASPQQSLQSLQKLETVSIYVMEAGIIFHSLIIGLTLVVAGDSFLLTLFAVILFHQMFEGLALGTRIAAMGSRSASITSMVFHSHHGHQHALPVNVPSGKKDASTEGPETENNSTSGPLAPSPPSYHVSMAKKLSLAAAFALVTPLGMAIGIGVLHQFNGNDPQTIVAIGVLDAFSAGILLWVGVVEMWAADWVHAGGALTDAGLATTCIGLGGLVAGMIVMSVLGKWA